LSDYQGSDKRRRILAEQIAQEEQCISEINAELERRCALVFFFQRTAGSHQAKARSIRAAARSSCATAHSFVTRQIRRTKKIQAVSSYLGHSSIAITIGFYVHKQLDDDELFDPGDGE
jgi:integrase